MKIRYTTDPDDAPASKREPGAVSALAARIAAFAREHSAGRVWWYRLPVLLLLAWIFRGWWGEFNHQSIFGGLNLGIHEAGHLFLGWFGNRLLAAAGGTLFQLLAPIGAAIMFYRQRDVFAIAVAAFWLGDNLASVAPYAADARWQLLNLVSPVTGNPDHDWNTILGILGLLQHDETIGNLFRWSGLATMAGALLAGAWILRLMATTEGPARFASAGEGSRFAEFLAGHSTDGPRSGAASSGANPPGPPRPSSDDPGAEIRRQAGLPPSDEPATGDPPT